MRLFIYCFIMILFTGCVGDSTYSPSVDTNSFDYKYSKTRFQMEGLNSKDSDTAARAVMKFNEAQKNRKR